MTEDPFQALRAARLEKLEEQLRAWLPLSRYEGGRRLNDALQYEIQSGGKRIRPLLALCSADLFGLPDEQALPLACAIEYLHLASVIFDDLPGMDDARMRRHVPALHVVFGDATAILAALALFTRAFEILAEWPTLVKEAARAVGHEGMIAGQAVDLTGGRDGRLLKTSALMRFAVSAPARAAAAHPASVVAIEEFGESMGEAYQLLDDLVDMLEPESSTGKTAGQDVRHSRQSLPPDGDPRGLYEQLCQRTAYAATILRDRLPPSHGSDRLMKFILWVEQRAGELIYGHDADRVDRCRTGVGCGERDPVAES